MSADLLAAFGTGDSTTDDVTTINPRPAADTVVPRPHPLQLGHQSSTSAKEEHPLWQKDHQGTDVLFDASEPSGDEEDDFGDFEGPEVANNVRQLVDKNDGGSGGVDLLGIDELALQNEVPPKTQSSTAQLDHTTRDPFEVFGDVPTSSHIVSREGAEADNPDDDWGDFESVKQMSSAGKPEQRMSRNLEPVKPASIDVFEDETWDAFEDGPTPQEKPLPTPTNAETQNSIKASRVVSEVTVSSTAQTMTKTRPTNIPPPFSLLQLLTPAVHRLSSRSSPTLTGPNLLSLANQIVSMYRTTSRVIAGRQHRWKRDTILAQSMRISQVSHKTTGMKLTSLDRSESVKEDQEAIEAVAAWTKYSHTLNPVLLKAKVQKPAMSLNADLKIRVMSGPGIIGEREPCAVCGLKRNERVVGVDIKVEDIFEEFWIQHWGHTECRMFWFEHNDLLNHR